MFFFCLWRLLWFSLSPLPDISPPLRIDLLLFPPVIQLSPRSCNLSTLLVDCFNTPLLLSFSAGCAVLISSYMSAAANARLHPSVFGPNIFLFLLQDTWRTGRRLRDGQMRRTEKKSSSSQEALDELKDKCALTFLYNKTTQFNTFFN